MMRFWEWKRNQTCERPKPTWEGFCANHQRNILICMLAKQQGLIPFDAPKCMEDLFRMMDERQERTDPDAPKRRKVLLFRARQC